MIPLVCISLVLIWLLLQISQVAIRNYRAHQFFKNKSPELPILPNPNIFTGHVCVTTYGYRNSLRLSKLHEQYGPTFGYYHVEQPWVSTKDVDLIKFIYVDNSQKHINRADYGMPFTEYNNSIFQVKDDDWRRSRKAISPALTNHKIRSDEISTDVKLVVEELHQALEARWNEAKQFKGSRTFLLDATDMFQRYTLAVIFRITYKRDDLIDFYAERDDWTYSMDHGARNIKNPLLVLSKVFRFLRPVIRILIRFHRVGKINNKIIEYIINALDSNLTHHRKQCDQMPEKSNNGQNEQVEGSKEERSRFKRRLVDNIIQEYLDKKISFKHFVGTTQFLLLAGFQTTAESIAHLVWQLSKHPDIQDKLRKNIIAEGIESKYLEWCINESLRLHPPVPLGTGRILAEDVTCNGLYLPEGTFVMPSTYAIQHDEKIWPEADRFDPERWRNSKDFHPAAFMAFGLGPRNCVGSKLAMYESKLVMQMLLTNYRVVRCAETPEQYDFSDAGLIFTTIDEPIKVRIEPL